MRRPTLICASFLVVAVLLQPGVTRAESAPPLDYEKIIRQSDLVVYGVIRDMSRDEVPVTNLFPSDPRPDASITILILQLEVREGLKGYHKTPSLTLVVPSGLPGLRTDYNVGNEVILSAVYWKYMRGGSYMVTNDMGCFRNWNDRWFCQYVLSPHEATEVPMDSIRAAVDRSRPEVVASSAEIVAIVSVKNASNRRQPARNTSPAAGDRTIMAKLANVLKGPRDIDAVQFRAMRNTGDSSPQFNTGEQWLIYLGRDDDGYFLLDATNGAFRVEGDSLVQANRVVVPDTRDGFIARLKGALDRQR